MANVNKAPVTIQELLVSSLAQSDALAKLLIEKGIITQQEFLQKISEERATYQKLDNRGRKKRNRRAASEVYVGPYALLRLFFRQR